MNALERTALAFAESERARIVERNRQQRAQRTAPPVPPSPDGVVQLRCNVHGIIEERVSYSSIPLRLNGCDSDPKRPCIVNIVGYAWDRDVENGE